MKLSEHTLNVLQNFAKINSGVVINVGKKQRTISPAKSILVEATLEDDFDAKFGIYDLNQFLGNVTTLKNPELTFKGESVIIDDGELALTYNACSPNLIITPPEKELVLKTIDVTFSLSNASLQKLLKIALMNNLPNLSVEGKDGSLNLLIHEKTNDTSNQGSIKIGDYAGKDFMSSFKTENLKLLPGDYNVEIQTDAFAKFESADGKLKYWIALESK